MESNWILTGRRSLLDPNGVVQRRPRQRRGAATDDPHRPHRHHGTVRRLSPLLSRARRLRVIRTVDRGAHTVTHRRIHCQVSSSRIYEWCIRVYYVYHRTSINYTLIVLRGYILRRFMYAHPRRARPSSHSHTAAHDAYRTMLLANRCGISAMAHACMRCSLTAPAGPPQVHRQRRR